MRYKANNVADKDVFMWGLNFAFNKSDLIYHIGYGWSHIKGDYWHDSETNDKPKFFSMKKKQIKKRTTRSLSIGRLCLSIGVTRP